MRIYFKKNNGYIALISIIIMSAVLLLIAVGFGTKSLSARKGLAEIEYKEISYFTAYSCIDRALYELGIDYDYPGNKTLTIGTNQCTINSILKTNTSGAPNKKGKNRYITVSSTVQNHTTKLEMSLDENFIITIFKEI